MKKIIIKGKDIASISLWKELGKPEEHKAIALFRLEEGESLPVEAGVMPESNGLLIEVPKIFYDSLLDCCNKLLDAYSCADYKKVNRYKNGLKILLNR